MAILSLACKPDNFELLNCLNLSFMNIWGLCLNIVDCESFLESNSSDILTLCETNLDDSIDSGDFSVRGYLPSSWKTLVFICMVLQFIWMKSFLLHGTYLQKTLQIITYVFDWLYFTQCLTSFSSIDHLFRLYACFWFYFI